MPADPKAIRLLARYDRLKAQRTAFWDVLWQAIANYMLPRKSEITTDKSPGVEAYTLGLFDTTAMEANQVLAAGIATNTMPSTERWFAYEAPTSVKNQWGDLGAAAAWYQDSSDVIARLLASSNFYQQTHEVLLERSPFGTGNLYSEPGRENAFNFKAIPIGSFVFTEDDQGKPTTCIRAWKWTVAQAAAKWGEDKLPPKLRSQYSSGQAKDLDCEYEFIHGVFPREHAERQPGAENPANKPFASLWVCREESHLIDEGGYDENPYAISRFLCWPGEVWGWGPGIVALPTTRQVNHIERQMDALAEVKAFPRTLIPSNLKGAVDLRPAGVTTWDVNVPQGKPETWADQGEYDVGEVRTQRKQQAIRKAFFNDLFAMLQGIEPGKATWGEIQLRVQEKLELFNPTFNSWTNECLSPTLIRCFWMAFRQGLLPDPPPEVMIVTGSEVSVAGPAVSYTSNMALALKRLQNRSTIDTMQTLAPLAELRPDILDVFNLDTVAIRIARNNGMAPGDIREPEEVAAIREQRAQQQAAAENIAAAQGVAKAGADAAKATPEMRRQMQDAINV
jgi:hypothetical protein